MRICEDQQHVDLCVSEHVQQDHIKQMKQAMYTLIRECWS